jgi:hypothetical protein
MIKDSAGISDEASRIMPKSPVFNNVWQNSGYCSTISNTMVLNSSITVGFLAFAGGAAGNTGDKGFADNPRLGYLFVVMALLLFVYPVAERPYRSRPVGIRFGSGRGAVAFLTGGPSCSICSSLSPHFRRDADLDSFLGTRPGKKKFKLRSREVF